MQISNELSQRLAEPQWRGSPIQNILICLMLGDCIILHHNNRNFHIFHNCKDRRTENNDETTSLTNKRIIRINTGFSRSNNITNLVNHILSAGGQYCTCPLKTTIERTTQIPYFYDYDLLRRRL